MASNIAEVILRIKQQGITELDQVVDALEQVQEKTTEAQEASEGFGETAGRVGQSSQKLAGAIGLISPAGQQAAMAVADLADVFEVAAEGGGLMMAGLIGVAAAAVAMVAGTVAAVAGIVELTQSSAEALPALEQLQRLAGAELVPQDTITRIEYANAALDAAAAGFQAAGAAIAASFAPQLQEAATVALQVALAMRDVFQQAQNLGQVFLALGAAALDGFLRPLDALVEGLGNLLQQMARAADAVGQTGLAGQLRDAGEKLEKFGETGIVISSWNALTEAVGGYRGEAEALIGAQVKVNRGIKDNSAELDRQREALFAVLDAVKELKMLEAEGALAPGRVDIRTEAADNAARLQQELQRIMASNPAQVFDNLRMLQADLNIEFSRGTLTLQEYEAALKSVDKAAADYRNAQELSRFKAATAAGTAIGGSVVGGSISGLVSTLGPMIGTAIAGPVGSAVGEALGQVVTFLEALGRTSIAEIKANMLQSAANIRAGLEMLPSLTRDLMPDLIQAIASGFIQALPELIVLQYQLLAEMALFPVRVVQGFVRGLGEWWSSIGGLQGLGQSMIEALASWWRSAWQAIRDFIRHPMDRDQDGRRAGGEAIDATKRALSFLWSGEFATGTDYVPRTGLALVHQGERIETARGGGMGARVGGGGDVHLHLSGFAVGTADQLIRELNKHLGGSNRRLSWST